jgi:hypothetical protein
LPNERTAFYHLNFQEFLAAQRSRRVHFKNDLRVEISDLWTTRINLLLLFSFPLANAAAQSPAPMNRIDLYSGWTVQTSRKVQATGDSISRPKFQTKGWYRTSVPMTVVAVQVAAGEFPEPYYGMNRHGGEIGRMNADAKTLRETWGLNCAACGLDLASPPGSRGAVL